MSFDELAAELRTLSRADKLRVLQVLITDLLAEETRLQTLLDGITEENRHDEVDTGPAVGKEIW